MSPLQALQARERRRVTSGLSPQPLLRISLADVPADLMLAFTADRGWHWAYSPPDAAWEAMEA